LLLAAGLSPLAVPFPGLRTQRSECGGSDTCRSANLTTRWHAAEGKWFAIRCGRPQSLEDAEW
jgi:hypothetical protein